MQKPTTEILKRIFENSSRHKDGVYMRLYRYLLREDIYLISYQKLSKNKGALTIRNRYRHFRWIWTRICQKDHRRLIK